LTLPLPSGPFGCILADPPWAFRNSTSASKEHRGAHDHYQTTETAALCEIPVASVAADDAALFMWVVDSHMDEALALGKAWGFEFKTCAFVWVKSKAGGFPHVGMGYWTRKQTEQCWLFTRGSPKRLDKGVQQIIHCPRGAHSAKPEQQYGLIERLVGGPYLEMFARTAQRGWSAWGNQVGARDASLFAEAAQ
jgi:N6-adenosine-specific RNA methylase IME4